MSVEFFKEQATLVHGGRYDYSLIMELNPKGKIQVICKKHGEFLISQYHHLKGSGCKICNGGSKYTTEEFIKKAEEIHGNKYDYSLVNYIDKKTPITIICNIHGEFLQKPSDHINFCGCQKCGKAYKRSKEEFIKESSKIHNNFYIYDKIEYINTKHKIIITCPNHGDFEQFPERHLTGQGCPKCNLKSQNKLFEKLKNSFNTVEILWEFSPNWLEKQRFDIYLPELNIAIEYNGIQHYEIKNNLFGGKEGFIKTQERDKLKREKCRLNNCTLFEVKYDYDDNDYEDLVTNIETIIKNFKNEIQCN